MRRVVPFVAAVVAALAVSGAAGSVGSGQARWVITDLGESGRPLEINERGQILVWPTTGGLLVWEKRRTSRVGVSGDAALNDRGQVLVWKTPRTTECLYPFFLWEDGRVRKLGAVKTGSAMECTPQVSFDNQGQVVVASWAGGVFRWRDGTWKKLGMIGTVGGERSIAMDVNGRAQVVGESDTATGFHTHAFLWQNGRIKDLGTLPGSEFSTAGLISVRGEITGESSVKQFGPVHAVVWRNGKMTDLGTLPGGRESEAGSINGRGQIIGVSDTKYENRRGWVIRHGFVWQNGRMTDLGSLAGNAGASSPVSINERGQIVGASDSTTLRKGGSDSEGHSMKGLPYGHAFVWENGRMTDLGTLPGGSESGASAVNDNGQIVGWATTKNGHRHAVLWTLRSG